MQLTWVAHIDRYSPQRLGGSSAVSANGANSAGETVMAEVPVQVGRIAWLRVPLLQGLTLLALLLALNGRASAQEVWVSDRSNYQLTYRSEIEPLPLNRMHYWIVRLASADNTPVADARILVSGGMPAHNHGLPTAPAVAEYLGAGEYRIEGFRFHMPGAWELIFDIQHQGRRERVQIALKI